MASDPGNAPEPSANAQRPDQGELEALYARTLPHVRAFVRLRIDHVTRDQEAVSDIVQSACREVLAKDGFEYRGETAFRGYLCQAALNKIKNHRRHYLAQKRGGGKVQGLGSEDPALAQIYSTTFLDPVRGAIRNEEVAFLEATFEKLPDQYREALTMYRIVGLPISDLARHFGRTEAATKMLLSRAMARLACLLERDPRA